MTVRRVLFVTHNFPRVSGDAAGGFLLDLAHALATVDVTVEVIAPHAKGLSERDVVEGIHVHRVRYGDDADETLAYTGTMAEQVKASTRGKRAMLRMIGAMRRVARRVDLGQRFWTILPPSAPSVPTIIADSAGYAALAAEYSARISRGG